ncbi:MAG: DUF1697 domain-containing protein [Bacteroidota bacterium]
MAVFITLLRGINVSGQKKIKMADFRTLLTESGLANVSTYIQSGNLVCQFDSSASDLSEHIAKAIQQAYGYEVEVFSNSPAYFSDTISQNPYGEDKIGRCYVTFLSEAPEEALVRTYSTP